MNSSSSLNFLQTFGPTRQERTDQVSPRDVKTRLCPDIVMSPYSVGAQRAECLVRGLPAAQ